MQKLAGLPGAADLATLKASQPGDTINVYDELENQVESVELLSPIDTVKGSVGAWCDYRGTLERITVSGDTVTIDPSWDESFSEEEVHAIAKKYGVQAGYY